MQVEKFLARLKDMQVQYALESTTSPRDTTSFGFGKICGVLEGLRRAEQLVEELVGEEKNDKFE